MIPEINVSDPNRITPDQVIAYLTKLAKNIDEPKTNRAVIYIRKSRVLKNSKHYSPEIQRKQCYEIANRMELEVINVVEDLNKSGKNSDRPGLQKILGMIKSKQVDFVISQYVDRNYRNGLSLLKFYEKAQEYGTVLISVNENIDTRTFGGRYMLYHYAMIAEAPIHLTSDRSRQAIARRKEDGYHHGGYRLGFCNGLCSTCTDPNGKGYCPLHGRSDRPESKRGRIQVPHPIETHAIRLIAYLYNQRFSGTELAILLNDNEFLINGAVVKFQTKGVPGSKEPGRFSSESVLDIVRNIFYVGFVAHYPTPPLSPYLRKYKLVTSMHKSCFSFGSMTSATKLPTVPEAVGDHKEDEFDSYSGIAEYFGRYRSSCQRQKTAKITTCFPRRPRRLGEMLKSMQFLKELENVVREKHQG